MKTQELPKTGLAGLKAHFKDDFLAGLIVSLIALPLCLGIASASNVPPLAGVITAIVGGILASRISGTFVTISGPAAGLIVITLGAVESMGSQGTMEGYPHALGAIVVGGAIMALFGFLKVGKVGDYFPSAAVHGMLAAIGVIIMIKLLFPALGVAKPKGEILEVATEIPHAFKHMNSYAAIISGITLLILIVHPMLKSKIIKVIPAPMWVLIFTIPMAMYLGTDNLDMVDLDGGLLGGGGLKFPSFEKIATSAFWIAVVGFALVSAIESLLSAKAVDSLDPYKRKSDLDRDLISMGAGSSVAAALGGLPMISEIVRSSANVNYGAKTQWANFFHGLFLLIYVVIGVSVIEMIPNAALAAMLVFTGFKLANPKEFKHMYKLGLMELEIFIVTLVAVLATDLIIGIIIGILFKYALVLFRGTKFNELFKSNFEIEHKDNVKIIHLKGSQIFSNYLSLKKRMDSGTAKYDEVIIDFSDAIFVDHTVIEHLEDYARLMALEGKEVHLINIESLNPLSNHPLAARDKRAKSKASNIDKREQLLLDFAKQNSYLYVEDIEDYKNWEFYGLSIRRKIVNIKNILSFNINRFNFNVGDVIVQKGAETITDVDKITTLKISGVQNVPKFFMHNTYLTDRIKEALGNEDIDFDNHPDFSDRFALRGDGQEKEIRAFFNDDVLTYFEKLDVKTCYLAGNGKDLALHFDEKLLSIDEIKQLIKTGEELVKLFK